MDQLDVNYVGMNGVTEIDASGAKFLPYATVPDAPGF